jgi:DUF1009 family protein
LIEENQTFQVEIHVPNKLLTSVVTFVKNYYFSFIKAHETMNNVPIKCDNVTERTKSSKDKLMRIKIIFYFCL